MPAIVLLHVTAASPFGDHAGRHDRAMFNWTPFVGGTAILASWIMTAMVLRINGEQLVAIFKKTWTQMWGACLVGVFIFGLAYVFNYLGHGGLARQSLLRDRAILHRRGAAPWLHRRGAVRQQHLDQRHVREIPGAGRQVLGFPLLLLPMMNSVGAEIGKPIAPQTASVGVSTSKFVRNEGEVIRHNFGWTLVLLAYLVLIGWPAICSSRASRYCRRTSYT